MVSGKFLFDFPDQQIELNKEGDYVMWGIGTDHRWQVLEDSLIITIRWPSIATD